MSRSLINIIVDVIAALLFLGMIATGYILRFTLPSGSSSALSLWGLTHHQYGDLHFRISVGLLAVIAVHLIFHWKWIVTVIVKRYHTAQTSRHLLLYSGILTLTTVTLTFMAFIWTAQQNVKPIVWPSHEPNAPDGSVQMGSTPAVRSENADSEVIFWKNVYPIFEKNCLPCHGPQKQYAGFRADRRDNFFGNIGRNPLVVPGKSNTSPLIAIVSGARDDLPRADAHTLSEHDVLQLRAWIDAGAKWPEK